MFTVMYMYNYERRSPSRPLFYKLRWLPFYEDANIARCSIVFKCLHGTLPPYLNQLITVNNQIHSRSTRYCNYNVLCPRYVRQTDGGRTFGVIASRLWNSLSLNLRKSPPLKSFKYNMRKSIFDRLNS